MGPTAPDRKRAVDRPEPPAQSAAWTHQPGPAVLTAPRGRPGSQGLLAERQRMVHFQSAAQRATCCFAPHRTRCCSGFAVPVELCSRHHSPTTSPAAPAGAPQPCCPHGGAVETVDIDTRPPNDGPGRAPGTRVPARDRGKSGPKPRSSTPTPGRADWTRLREPGAISQQPRALGPPGLNPTANPRRPNTGQHHTPRDPTTAPHRPWMPGSRTRQSSSSSPILSSPPASRTLKQSCWRKTPPGSPADYKGSWKNPSPAPRARTRTRGTCANSPAPRARTRTRGTCANSPAPGPGPERGEPAQTVQHPGPGPERGEPAQTVQHPGDGELPGQGRTGSQGTPRPEPTGKAGLPG